METSYIVYMYQATRYVWKYEIQNVHDTYKCFTRYISSHEIHFAFNPPMLFSSFKVIT